MTEPWRDEWAANPRRWDNAALLLLPVGARVFEGGVSALRTSSGLSWRIQYRRPVVAGSRRTKSVQEVLPNCRNRTQALGVVATRKGEVFQHTFQPRASRDEKTLADFLPEFVRLRGHRKTIGKYEGQITREFIPQWGSIPLRAIKRADVQGWYVRRLELVAIATANRELAALRTLYSEAIANDLCEVNPCKGVKARAEHNARDRMLSESEAAALAKAANARNDYMRVLYFTLYFTGARLSEALELRWKSVDLERAVLVLVDAKDGKPRNVPIRADLVAILKAWRPDTDGVFVFPGRLRGKRLVRVSTQWGELCAAAKVALTPHELRHNFVSQLQAQGVADTIIMDLTGHRTLTMLKRYSHSRDAQRADAVSKLPS